MGRDKYFYHYTDPKGAKAIEKAGKINKAHVAAFGPGM